MCQSHLPVLPATPQPARGESKSRDCHMMMIDIPLFLSLLLSLCLSLYLSRCSDSITAHTLSSSPFLSPRLLSGLQTRQ